jgi:hypothetical protein
MNTLVAIDPSVASLGIAYAYDGEVVLAERIQIRGQKDVDVRARSLAMGHAVAEHLRSNVRGYATSVLEVPANYGSGKGLDSRRSGNVQTLYFTAGILVGTLAASCKNVWCVEPHHWKGSAPKSVMVKRAKTILDIDYPSDDVAEAVCLLNRFKIKRPDEGHWHNVGPLAERVRTVVV